MIWSLNEIDALCRKAAKGSGLSWGLAEEAGKAARWLAEQGIPGPTLLAQLLKRNDGTPYADLVPTEVVGVWTSAGGTLCPLIAGAALCDRAEKIANGAGVTLARIAFPLLLAPYADAIARPRGLCIALTWQGTTLTLTPGGLVFAGDAGTLLSPEAKTVSISIESQPKGAALAIRNGREIPPEASCVLHAFAHRTYAPATEASRAAGAGAGTSDND